MQGTKPPKRQAPRRTSFRPNYTMYTFDDVLESARCCFTRSPWPKAPRGPTPRSSFGGETGTGKGFFAQSIHNASPGPRAFRSGKLLCPSLNRWQRACCSVRLGAFTGRWIRKAFRAGRRRGPYSWTRWSRQAQPFSPNS